MAIYNRHLWQDNNILTPYGPLGATRLNEMEDGIVSGTGDHSVRVFRGANLAVGTGSTGVAIVFANERFDTDAYHDVSVNNTRLTVPANLDGKYLIGGAIQWESSTLGTFRRLYILLNGDGANPIGGMSRSAVADNMGGLVSIRQTATTMIDLNAGDYVELQAAQDSGSNLNLTVNGPGFPSFWAIKLA